MKSNLRGLLVLNLALAMMLGAAGCQVATPAGFLGASVLTGTWKLVPGSATNGPELYYVFDAGGQLVEIRTISGNVTIVEKDVQKSVNVDGSTVRVVTNKDVVFEGTLNEEKTVVTGSLFTEVTVGSVTATINNGAATLTKQ